MSKDSNITLKGSKSTLQQQNLLTTAIGYLGQTTIFVIGLATQNGFATDLKNRSLKPPEQKKITIKKLALKG